MAKFTEINGNIVFSVTDADASVRVERGGEDLGALLTSGQIKTINGQSMIIESTGDTTDIVIEGGGLKLQAVEELPEEGEEGIMYLLPIEDSNEKEEYIWVLNGEEYGWEMIGTTAVDLSDYYTKTEIDNSLENIYTKTEIDSSLENIYTKDEVDSSLENIYTKDEVDSSIEEASASEEPYVILEPVDGEYILESNKRYFIDVTTEEGITFVLPDVDYDNMDASAGYPTQDIEVLFKISTSNYTIDLGTDKFVNDVIPTIDTASSYTILYSFDFISSEWYVGMYISGAVS